MLSLVYFYLLYYFLHFSLYGIFKKAGKNPIHCFIPFLQDKTWLEMIGKNPRKALWGLIPYVNILFALTWVTDTMNCFGKTAFWQHLIATFFGYLYFPVMGWDKKTKYQGALYADNKKVKRSTAREWADAIVFAIVAASFVRMFVIEAYKIPTTSMEGSLLAGDYLFVSKLNYGARTPMTPIAFPFAHHTMPLMNTAAYSKIIQLGYHRLPGFESIKRGDVVVFNYPGDAVEHPERPIDKRENYVKRCVAIAGDTIKIVNRQLYINGVKQPDYRNMQYSYDIQTNGTPLSIDVLSGLGLSWFYDIHTDDQLTDMEGNLMYTPDVCYNIISNRLQKGEYTLLLTDDEVSKIKKLPNVKSVTPTDFSRYTGQLFPGSEFKWNQDNYGALIVPRKGWTIPLDTTHLLLYGFTIKLYERQAIELNDGVVTINGQPVKEYTFKQDYYWMMGDNRHNSADSRFWGFVPEDHIVGKPLFVWFSKNNYDPFPQNIKWKRIFRSVTSLCK